MGPNAFSATTDYVSAFKPQNKVQTISEFQKSLNSDLYKPSREVMSENSSVELVNNNNANPSEEPVEI